jgi:hypothetical protein
MEHENKFARALIYVPIYVPMGPQYILESDSSLSNTCEHALWVW